MKKKPTNPNITPEHKKEIGTPQPSDKSELQPDQTKDMSATAMGSDRKGLTNQQVLESPKIVMKLYVDYFSRGRSLATMLGTLVFDSEEVKPLEDQARAAAMEIARESFDPKNNLHDKIRQNEYEQNIANRKEYEKGEKHTGAKVREKEEALAKVQESITKPEPPFTPLVGGTLMIGLSLCPTLHDRIFYSLADEMLSWVASASTGIMFGLTIAFCILGTAESTSERNTANYGGVIGGFILGIGAGLLRLTGVQTTSEIFFCVALSLIEISGVVLLEFAARGQRTKHQSYTHKKKQIEQATAELEVAVRENNRWKDKITKVNQAIQDFLNYVEERALRNLSVNQIAEAAAASVRDGFMEGVAENQSRILGLDQDEE